MATRRLPEEVVIEILSWLPAKDLIRSRCVCKAWFKLLTIDLHFHKLHLNRLTNYHSKHNPTILLEQLQNHSLHLAATDTPEIDEASTMEIVCPFNISSERQHGIFGISNGLVCLATPSQQEFHNIYIWNPLTKDHITIPCPHVPSHFPLGSSITYGFGFCQATTEFKIVRIISWNYLEFYSHVSVFTLGTNSWRTLGSIPYDINILEHHTALVNDAIHWFAEWPDSLVRNVIASFNMREEIFQEVPHPPSGTINYDYPNYVTIGELDGLLCIFWAFSTEYVQIWVMKEYGNVDSWTNQFKIGRPEVRGEFYFLRPLGFTDNGEIIIDKNGQKIILYNPRTNSTRRIKKFDCQFYRAFAYIGSIVSPRLINGVDISPI